MEIRWSDGKARRIGELRSVRGERVAAGGGAG